MDCGTNLKRLALLTSDPMAEVKGSALSGIAEIAKSDPESLVPFHSLLGPALAKVAPSKVSA